MTRTRDARRASRPRSSARARARVDREDERRSSRERRRARRPSRQQLGVVDERGPVQRHERRSRPARARSRAHGSRRARALDDARAASRSSCCRRDGRAARRCLRARGSRARSPSGRAAGRATWSVSARLCSSGIAGSKLRRPGLEVRDRDRAASTAASAPASVELTSPGTTTSAGCALEQHLLDRRRARAPSARRACPSRRRGRRRARAARARSRNTSDISRVVVLPGVDEQRRLRVALAGARRSRAPPS